MENFGKATGGTSIESEFSEDGIYKVISIGSYSENSIYNDQGIRAIKSDKTCNRVLNKNDLTMILNDKTISGNIIGRVLLIEKSGVYVYNQRTERIETNVNEYDSLFLYEMLNAPNIREKIIKRAQGNTQIYVNWSVIAMLDYMIPSKEEQAKIGQYLHSISNLITLHQCKCDYLIRLKCWDFSSLNKTAWEQRKAKELFVSTADKGYPELPVLSATQNRGMIRRDENSINIFHDKKNEAGYKRVLPGQFVIHLRSFQGGFAHSAIEGITSPAYTVFGFSEPEKHDSEYWKYVFTSKSFIRRLETVTYGIRDGRSISYDEFLTLGFAYPSKAEQTAIAQYLDKLSDLITLHQREWKGKRLWIIINCLLNTIKNG